MPRYINERSQEWREMHDRYLDPPDDYDDEKDDVDNEPDPEDILEGRREYLEQFTM